MRLFIIFFVMIFIGNNAFAGNESITKWVWRVDKRPPEVVFREGFTRWGDNINVLDHLLGRSCYAMLTATPDDPANTPERRTAFISVSSDLNYVRTYAQRMLQHESTMYLYYIRPTVQFFSSVRTIDYFLDNGFENYRSARRAAYDQSEWITDQPILPSQIYGVETFTLENLNPTIETNDQYDQTTSVVEYNGNAYTETVDRLHPITVTYVTRTMQTLSACFSATLFCGRAERERREIDNSTCSPEKITISPRQKLQYYVWL